MKSSNFLREAPKIALTQANISRTSTAFRQARCLRVADNCHTQAYALLTALLTTVKCGSFAQNLVRNSGLTREY